MDSKFPLHYRMDEWDNKNHGEIYPVEPNM